MPGVEIHEGGEEIESEGGYKSNNDKVGTPSYKITRVLCHVVSSADAFIVDEKGLVDHE